MNDIRLSEIFEPLRAYCSEFGILEDCCVCLHTEPYTRSLDPVNALYKVEGAVFLMITRGSAKVSYNVTDYTLDAPAAIVFKPGSTINISSTDWTDAEVYAMYFTREFMQDVNVSFSAISGEAMLERSSPVIKLEPRELPSLLRYFKQLSHVISADFNNVITRHIVASLTAACIYHLGAIFNRQIGHKVANAVSGRRSNYVQEFLKLVLTYYMKERCVEYYARRLMISPKYLSLLVKEATGRSASKWIDHFVIIEAKNQLRFSGKNIQQVAYALNFPNQSAFGKYFKHLTGVSPTEFQKG